MNKIPYERPPAHRLPWINEVHTHAPWTRDQAPPWRTYVVTAGPALVMSVHMTRWHRARWAWSDPTRLIAYTMWCGAELTAWVCQGNGLFTDQLPPGETLCGTCEGRAVGAGLTPAGVAAPTRLVHHRRTVTR